MKWGIQIDLRIIEWFVLEGTFKDHLAQLPCYGQGIPLVD